ncbi:MAG TPA: dipeptide/oligopeptide/nickel ABC transporter permease/ATP-binding protein [Cellulomonas sp.]
MNTSAPTPSSAAAPQAAPAPGTGRAGHRLLAADGLLRRVVRRPGVVVSLVWLGALLVLTFAAPLIARQDPLAQDLSAQLQLPSAAHLLGTDALGRDILSRLLHGGQGVIVAALIATAIGVALAVPAGLVAGYLGGVYDQALVFVINVLYAIPGFVIMVVVAFLTDNNIYAISVVLGVTYLAGIARIVRASTQETRDLLYVDSARVAGLSRPRILFRHVLPSITGPLVVQAFFSAGVAFVLLTSLSFLGLGFSPETASWGRMLYDATRYMAVSPWQIVPIGVVLVVTIVALNHCGSVVRDELPQAQRASLLRPWPGLVRRVLVRRVLERRRAAAAGDRSTTTRDRAGSGPDDRPDPDRATGPAAPAGDDAMRDAPEGISRGQRLVVVENLHVTFPSPEGDRNHVVDGIGFDVLGGEVLALVGESGSGKTMTALAIAGLLSPTAQTSAARLAFAGHDLRGLDEVERNELRGTSIGLVAQEPMMALDPSFTVGSVIREVLRVRLRMTRAQARTETQRLLRLMGIVDPRTVAASYPHQLSGGMAQRVAIALALAARPALLIADEPTTALDVTIQAEVLDLLRDLARDLGTTVLVVTHDFGVVADLATRVAVMRQGRIVEIGAVTDVIGAPQHPYTRELLAALDEKPTTRRPAAAPAQEGHR